MKLKAGNIKKAGGVALLLLLILNGCGASTRAFTNHPEPDGFRSIKWETEISKLKDMEEAEKVKSSSSDSAWYTRKNDALDIGKAKVESIFYSFWMGEFESVWIDFKGDNNFEALNKELIGQYGKPYESEMGSMKETGKLAMRERPAKEYSETLYVWWGKNTEIWLSYLKELHQGTLTFNSTRLSEEKRVYEERKAKENLLNEKKY